MPDLVHTIPELDLSTPEDATNLPEPDEPDFTEFEEVEARLQQEDEQQQQEKRVPTQAELRQILENRYKEDGVPSNDSKGVVDFLVGLKGEWEAWSRDEEVKERVSKEWDRIKEEWHERLLELEGQLEAEGKGRVKFGTFPHGNPLSSLVLNVLLFPHDRVDPNLSFLDKTVATFRALNAYDFWWMLEDGIGSAFDTHPHQEHSSSRNDPTFPADGRFKCDQRIHELGLWLTREVYEARKRLLCPGLLLLYGDFNQRHFTTIRSDDSFEISTLDRRLTSPETVTLARSFRTYIVKNKSTGKILHIEAELPHPSSPAYAALAGAAATGREFALPLDRALEEVLLTVRRPLSTNPHPFFARQAFAMSLGAKGVGRQWGIAVVRLLTREVQEREVIRREKGDAEADDWKGFSLVEVQKLGGWIAKSVEKWSNYYIKYEETFKEQILHFSKIERPTTLLSQAKWAINWYRVLLERITAHPISLTNNSSVTFNIPSALPLTVSGRTSALYHRDSRAAPLPADYGSSILSNLPSALPLSITGETSARLQRDRYVAPLSDAYDSPIVSNTTSALPLSITGHSSRQHHHRLRFAAPLPAGQDSPILLNTPSTLPAAVGDKVAAAFHGDRPALPCFTTQVPHITLNTPSTLPLGLALDTANRLSGENSCREIKPLPARGIAGGSIYSSTASGIPLSNDGLSVATGTRTALPLTVDSSRAIEYNLPAGTMLSGSRKWNENAIPARPLAIDPPSVALNLPSGTSLTTTRKYVNYSTGVPSTPLPLPDRIHYNTPSATPISVTVQAQSTNKTQAARATPRPVQPFDIAAGNLPPQVAANIPSGLMPAMKGSLAISQGSRKKK